MTNDHQNLNERFCTLWQRLGATQDTRLAETGRGVVARYQEQGRAYHNITHLEDVLSKLDLAKTALEKSGEIAHLGAIEKQRLFDTIELALWYHDVIYDATKKDSEAQSRDLFLSHAAAAGLDDTIRRDVARLIDITAHHKNADTLDERILTDCDLAILGADDAAFERYDDNIRKEYAHVPAPAYAMGRKKVLEGFLNQPQIFKTDAFRALYETQARKNLTQATSSPVTAFFKKVLGLNRRP